MEDVRVKLESTKKKYNTLKSADEKQDVNYVFTYINCRWKVILKYGVSEFLKDISELNEPIEQRMLNFLVMFWV